MGPYRTSNGPMGLTTALLSPPISAGNKVKTVKTVLMVNKVKTVKTVLTVKHEKGDNSFDGEKGENCEKHENGENSFDGEKGVNFQTLKVLAKELPRLP